MAFRPLTTKAFIARLIAASLFALGAGAGLPAIAQEDRAAAQQDGGIVVSGSRATTEQITEFARDLTEVDVSSPIATYQAGDYCPGVVGLAPAVNLAIAARMRQVAKASNMVPADPGCETSALVMFVNNGPATIKRFRQQHPEYFQELTGEEVAFSGLKTPVAAWKLTARLDRDGNPLLVDPETGWQVVSSYVGGSRLESMSRLVIAMSVLVLEKSAVRGLTTRQIADYALMRSVAETDPARLQSGGAPTILGIIETPEGKATPLSLTNWDLAYVKARYALNPLNYGPRQLTDIRQRMARDLDAVSQGND